MTLSATMTLPGSDGDRNAQTLTEQLSEPTPCTREKLDKESVGWRRIVRNFTPS